MKQAIIIRTDLKMEKGKIASQCAHASVAAFIKSEKKKSEQWLSGGMKKIVLKVSSKKDLHDIYKKANADGMKAVIITDAGLTQLKKPEKTAVGIGPDDDNKIDKITGKLKLL